MRSKTHFTMARRESLRRLGTLAAAAILPALPQPAMAAANLAAGKKAPPIVLHTLDGRQIALQSLAGHVVILTFWATWCEPCREELPLLSRYAASRAKEGLAVLGFSLDEPENLSDVQKVADTLSFPVGLLGSAWAGGYGRMWRLPVSFVVDRDGKLAENGWDLKDPVITAEHLARVVDPLLAQAPQAPG
jgi:cytochrome c biogenesis protein CcmG/thiol:disulfide interchange protein DsbE